MTTRRKIPKRFPLDPVVLRYLEQLRVRLGYTHDSELLAHLIRQEWEKRVKECPSLCFALGSAEQPADPAKGAAQGPTRITKPTKYPPSAAPDHLNEK